MCRFVYVVHEHRLKRDALTAMQILNHSRKDLRKETRTGVVSDLVTVWIPVHKTEDLNFYAMCITVHSAATATVIINKAAQIIYLTGQAAGEAPDQCRRTQTTLLPP